MQALFPAIQNVLLACRAVGLGASLTTVHLAYGREIDAWLGLPENAPTCALLPIGWPVGPYGRPARRPVDACLFGEVYGAPLRGDGPPPPAGEPFDTDNETSLFISAEIEGEAFLLENFSVSASAGIGFASIRRWCSGFLWNISMHESISASTRNAGKPARKSAL